MEKIITSESSPETGRKRLAYVVEERANPSSAFFVLPAVAASGYEAVGCSFSDLPSPADLEGAVVIFVRYVPPAWAKLVQAVRPTLRALVFFMDDDVLDIGASVGTPWRYRFKLARMATRRREWLRRNHASIWVSSQYLQQKYADLHPELVLPSYMNNASDVRRVFYHGTASHDAEIRWIRPVLDEVLRRDERITLEIVGGRNVHRMYRGMERVTVIHQMKWPAYQGFRAMPGRHIGLAPLLDVPFNLGRSYTKFFDITRCGAVGIYSPDSIYAEVVQHQVSGLIVPLLHDAWVEAILSLAQNEPLRQSMLRNAEVKSAALDELAQRSYSGLINSEADEKKTT